MNLLLLTNLYISMGNNNEKDIRNTSNAFKDIDKLYIADGHHRTASSALLSKLNKSKENNYFMSYLIDEKQLRVLSFNRLIKSLNGLKPGDFINKIKDKFKVKERKSPTLLFKKMKFACI